MELRFNMCFLLKTSVSYSGFRWLKATVSKYGNTSYSSYSAYCTWWQLFSSVSEPKITSGPMCSLWYENNQFGHNEIKIKGTFEQKQICCDRLSSWGNLKAAVLAAWNGIFWREENKPWFLQLCWLHEDKLETTATWKKHQYYPLVAFEWLTQPDSRATFSLTDWNVKPH